MIFLFLILYYSNWTTVFWEKFRNPNRLKSGRNICHSKELVELSRMVKKFCADLTLSRDTRHQNGQTSNLDKTQEITFLSCSVGRLGMVFASRWPCFAAAVVPLDMPNFLRSGKNIFPLRPKRFKIVLFSTIFKVSVLIFIQINLYPLALHLLFLH